MPYGSRNAGLRPTGISNKICAIESASGTGWTVAVVAVLLAEGEGVAECVVLGDTVGVPADIEPHAVSAAVARTIRPPRIPVLIVIFPTDQWASKCCGSLVPYVHENRFARMIDTTVSHVCRQA
ncbi:hypothetical protein Back2_01880 [Nocardioides baekrokdamisoli]|uniref:Uncharacterized protein n=1 Tax=Nocardioides baekrokdamisoli TaxID=1804624 RepID=A0A3G9IQJ3_9ACTN|nr:hypothetical protein Back2_01880 [Nocardioides baekrokdamisoli]